MFFCSSFWGLVDPLSRALERKSYVFLKCDCRPPGGLNRFNYCVQKQFDRCSHETDSFHVINIRKVALFAILKELGDRMRFECQIWVLKGGVKCVNQEGLIDLLEKSVK